MWIKEVSVFKSELKDSRLLVQKGIFYDGNDIAWRRDVKDAKKVKISSGTRSVDSIDDERILAGYNRDDHQPYYKM